VLNALTIVLSRLHVVTVNLLVVEQWDGRTVGLLQPILKIYLVAGLILSSDSLEKVSRSVVLDL